MYLFDRIAWVFNRSGAILALALGISKPSERVYMLVFFTKSNLNEISNQVYGIILSFLITHCFKRFWMGKSSSLLVIILHLF